MDVITISRQLGSLGSEIAKEVSLRSGFRLVWRDLINQAAMRAGAPEVALATIDDLGLLGITPSAAVQRAYICAVQTVMEELAREGKVVIVGRAGQMILRGYPNVLHVKIIAPVEVRIARTAKKQGIMFDAARAQVEASDASRRKYLKRYYGVNWEDMNLYDLTINTVRLNVQAASELICACLAQ
jgi:cytidylate kinase